tara:strand:- start:89 stop:331 length:243 start_codon:yes stop_codon:yes gene_type:complete
MIEDFLLCLVLGIITSAGITYFVTKKFLEDMWRGADSILGSFLIVVALIIFFIFCVFCTTFLGSIVFRLIQLFWGQLFLD